jgi:peptidase E
MNKIDTSKRKMLLTSAGLETQEIINTFQSLVEKSPKEIKALFIPTAANSVEAISVVPDCMNDLLSMGVEAKNITVFDLHRSLTTAEIFAFDVIYFTGGSTEYLLERINDTGFNNVLHEYINNGGIYIGVSAGSCVVAGNYADNLGYLKARLFVHTETGTSLGEFDNETTKQIALTDSQAVLIRGDIYKVI